MRRHLIRPTPLPHQPQRFGHHVTLGGRRSLERDHSSHFGFGHRPQRKHAEQRPDRGEREREAPRSGGNDGERGRHARDNHAEQGLLKPECRAGARRAGRLGRCCKRKAVPRHADDARHDERWDEEGERGVDEGRHGDGRGCEREADHADWPKPSAHAIGPAPGTDSCADAENVDACEHAGCGMRRDAAVLMQEEDEKARRRDLRGDKERRATAEQPHLPVTKRLCDVAELRRRALR